MISLLILKCNTILLLSQEFFKGINVKLSISSEEKTFNSHHHFHIFCFAFLVFFLTGSLSFSSISYYYTVLEISLCQSHIFSFLKIFQVQQVHFSFSLKLSMKKLKTKKKYLISPITPQYPVCLLIQKVPATCK